jgi:hypothetical protein
MSAHTKKHLMYWLIEAGPEATAFVLFVLRAWIKTQQ